MILYFAKESNKLSIINLNKEKVLKYLNEVIFK